MKRKLCYSLFPFMILAFQASSVSAIEIVVDEITFTYSFPSDGGPRFFDDSSRAPYVPSGGGGGRPDRQPNPCTTIDSTYAQCKRDSQNIYLSATKNCGKFTWGGSAVGAGGIGAAAAMFALGSNPYGWGLLALGSVGAGAGAWGSSSCYSGPAATRDVNLSICDNNQAKVKQACGS